MSNPSAQLQLALNAVWDPLQSFIDEAKVSAVDAYEKYTKLSGFKRQCAEGYISALGGFNVEVIMNELIIDNSWLEIMSKIWELMLPLGLSLLLVNFLLQVNEDAMSKIREFDFKMLSMLLIKLFAGVLAVYFGPQIIGGLCSMSNSMIYYVLAHNVGIPNNSASVDYAAIFSAIVESIDSLGILAAVALLINSAVLGIMGLIPNAIILFQAITRRIEIIIRGGCACVALPDLFNDARRSLCVTYIKKFAVCLMQGAFMIVICNIVKGIQLSYLSTIATNIASTDYSILSFSTAVRACLYGFAACGLCAAVKPILNDMLGV